MWDIIHACTSAKPKTAPGFTKPALLLTVIRIPEHNTELLLKNSLLSKRPYPGIYKSAYILNAPEKLKQHFGKT
jgi:hypothetical protein